MKRFSFILALIMTFISMIGVFGTTAFAAGDGTEANPITVGASGDYSTVAAALAASTAASGDYSTVAAALAASTADPVYIKVLEDVNEAAGIAITKNVVIFAENDGVELSVPDTSGKAGAFIVTGGSLTIDNLDVTVTGDGSTNATDGINITGPYVITIRNSAITAYGRAIRYISDGKGVAGTLTVTDSTLNSLKHKTVQHNDFNDAKVGFNAVFTRVGFSTATGTTNGIAVYSKNDLTNVTFDGCYTLEGGKIGYTYGTDGGQINGTIDFIDCNMDNEYYPISLKSSNDNGIVCNFYSGTYRTKQSFFCNTKGKAISPINVYGGTFDAVTLNPNNVSYPVTGNATLVNFYGGTVITKATALKNNGYTNPVGDSIVQTVNTVDGISTYTWRPLIEAGAAQLLAGTTATTETTSVRLVLTLTATEAELADLANLGTYVSLSEDANTTGKRYETTTVYTSVNASGTVVEAADGTYFVLVEIQHIPNANVGDRIYVKPFVTVDGSEVLGAEASFTVNGLIG